MKIYSSRRDDLIAERDAYDAETQKYEDIVEKGYDDWRNARYDQGDAIAEEIRQAIGPTSLNLQFNVDGYRDEGWNVRISSDEPNKFDKNVALSWDWDAKLDSGGNVVKESGSWSGLSATTPEQIASLEESVRVIKILNALDWNDICHRPVPDAKDYVDQEAQKIGRDRRSSRKDYNKLINDAAFQDALEDGLWIKLDDRPETDYYRGNRGTYWCKVLKLTDKFVTCYIVRELPDGQVDLNRVQGGYEERISKEKLFRHIAQPFETADLG